MAAAAERGAAADDERGAEAAAARCELHGDATVERGALEAVALPELRGLRAPISERPEVPGVPAGGAVAPDLWREDAPG